MNLTEKEMPVKLPAPALCPTSKSSRREDHCHLNQEPTVQFASFLRRDLPQAQGNAKEQAYSGKPHQGHGGQPHDRQMGYSGEDPDDEGDACQNEEDPEQDRAAFHDNLRD